MRIAAIGEASLRIAVQGGCVEIGRVRTEAGQKLTAADFAAQAGLKAGDRLESLDMPAIRIAAEQRKTGQRMTFTPCAARPPPRFPSVTGLSITPTGGFRRPVT